MALIVRGLVLLCVLLDERTIEEVIEVRVLQSLLINICPRSVVISLICLLVQTSHYVRLLQSIIREVLVLLEHGIRNCCMIHLLIALLST
jgi:hypothetical protein